MTVTTTTRSVWLRVLLVAIVLVTLSSFASTSTNTGVVAQITEQELSSIATRNLLQNDDPINAVANDDNNDNGNGNDVNASPRPLTRSKKGGKLKLVERDEQQEGNDNGADDNTDNVDVVPTPGKKGRRGHGAAADIETKRSGAGGAGKGKNGKGKRGASKMIDDTDINQADDNSDVDINDIIDNDKYVHFFSAFVASFSVIIVSEIGDKTFFIAAVMAMRHPRLEVFGSAIAALALMTVLSAAAGNILPNLLSPVYTHYASMVLFFYFGFKLLKQGWETDPVPKKNEELEEVEEELERSEHEEANPSTLEGGAVAKQQSLGQRTHKFFRRFFSPVFIQGFTMTFLAEWGDRSQIATIALAAARDPVGVTLGGILGHAICTGGAVISGKFAAARISERTVSFFGGACFLLCGLYSLYAGPDLVQPAA